MRLSDVTAGRLPAGIARGGYDRHAQRAGIVHLGIGAFHRAHQASYPDAAMAAGDRDAAADGFLGIVAADRDWNEGAARSQLLKLFEVTGLEDPWVSAQRRRLSAILFG